MLVDIDILPISLEKMYLQKKADLVCEVRVQGNAAVDVKWYNESDDQPQQQQGKGNPKSVTAVIHYDEWTRGMNWSCVAVIKDSIHPPVRKYFHKDNGECIFPHKKNTAKQYIVGLCVIIMMHEVVKNCKYNLFCYRPIFSY